MVPGPREVKVMAVDTAVAGRVMCVLLCLCEICDCSSKSDLSETMRSQRRADSFLGHCFQPPSAPKAPSLCQSCVVNAASAALLGLSLLFHFAVL